LLRIGRRKLAVGLGAVVVGSAAVLAWRLGGTDALVGVSLLTAFGGLAGLGYFVAQVERRYQQALNAASVREESVHDAQVQLLTSQFTGLGNRLNGVDARLDVLGSQLADQSSRIDILSGQYTRPSEHAEQLLRAVKAGYRRLELTQDRLEQRITKVSRKDSRDLFRQVEALVGLYLETGSKIGFPATRSWVASPDLLLYLHRRVRQQGIASILECGSGLSTVVMAYALRSNGTGRVVALEHLQEYADITNDLLSQHGLTDWAEVRLAPIEPVKIDAEMWPWYSVDAVPMGPFDLLFVDGPPGSTGPDARFPAVPLLMDRLAPRALIVLDDYARADENEITDRWLELFPDLKRESLGHEKGTAVLQFTET